MSTPGRRKMSSDDPGISDDRFIRFVDRVTADHQRAP